MLYVPLPPPEGRGAILQALTRKTPLAVDVDVAAVGASPQCHGFSGADLAALVREACICALKVYSQVFQQMSQLAYFLWQHLCYTNCATQVWMWVASSAGLQRHVSRSILDNLSISAGYELPDLSALLASQRQCDIGLLSSVLLHNCSTGIQQWVINKLQIA